MSLLGTARLEKPACLLATPRMPFPENTFQRFSTTTRRTWWSTGSQWIWVSGIQPDRRTTIGFGRCPTRRRMFSWYASHSWMTGLVPQSRLRTCVLSGSPKSATIARAPRLFSSAPSWTSAMPISARTQLGSLRRGAWWLPLKGISWRRRLKPSSSLSVLRWTRRAWRGCLMKRSAPCFARLPRRRRPSVCFCNLYAIWYQNSM